MPNAIVSVIYLLVLTANCSAIPSAIESKTSLAAEQFSPSYKMAVVRTSDPRSQADGALTDNDADVWLTAISRITDPGQLRRIVLTSMDPYVRSAAVRRIEDQPFLERVSKTEDDPNVQLAIGEQLTNELALDNLELQAKDSRSRCMVARVESLPTLATIVGDYAGHGIAELKDLIQHEVVEKRVSILNLTCTREIRPVYYRAGRDKHRVNGERVTIKLIRSGNVMMERSWTRPYRERINELSIDGYVKSGQHAEINVRPLVETVLDAAQFTPSEAETITMGLLPESGAGKTLVARTTHVESLRRLAAEHEAYGIREDVKARLTVLGK